QEVQRRVHRGDGRALAAPLDRARGQVRPFALLHVERGDGLQALADLAELERARMTLHRVGEPGVEGVAQRAGEIRPQPRRARGSAHRSSRGSPTSWRAIRMRWIWPVPSTMS